jgi:hypothetical protein
MGRSIQGADYGGTSHTTQSDIWSRFWTDQLKKCPVRASYADSADRGCGTDCAGTHRTARLG